MTRPVEGTANPPLCPLDLESITQFESDLFGEPRLNSHMGFTTRILGRLIYLGGKQQPDIGRGPDQARQSQCVQPHSRSVDMELRLLPSDGNGPHTRPLKRQKTSCCGVEDGLLYGRYTIAWICALHIEMAAAQAMMDEIHGELPRRVKDNNAYTLGNIKKHNIVIACLPEAQYGTNNAANVLTNVTRTFPSVRCGLMVGIGGGAPNKVDVRLGDVVVGTRVMQYDLGKVMAGGDIQRTAIPKIPDYSLRTVVTQLRAKHELQTSRIPVILQEKMRDHAQYSRPITPDRLFQASSRHEASVLNCRDCDQSQLKERETRNSQGPIIHYGAIASGNQVMKDATTRDNVAQELDIICFEMEAAGLMDVLPCLPIRGICDYSDSHKAKEWQRYAAATAAAYAREFLDVLAADDEEAEEPGDADSPTEQAFSIDRRKQLLESLKFEQIDSRKTTIKAAHIKTCHWFLKHPDYLNWLDFDKQADHHGFLWIRGKPGAGKSIIMKFIYMKVKKTDRRPRALTSSFFFNARGDCLEKSVSGMYRSLLLQLLEGFPDLQQVLDDPDLVPRNQNDCPSINVLKDLIRNAVDLLRGRSFTCFVDALDECDEQQVKDMVQFFEELAEHSTENHVRLRICFSSRHYPYVDVRWGTRLTLEDQLGHADDLESYITNRLQIRDRALVDELKVVMLEKAAGVFLWVALVVDILNQENSRGRLALRKRLAETPSGLSELFKDLLRRDKENMEELLLSILWILFAGRPLKPEEYYHALWSGLSLEGLADLEMPDVDASDASDCFDRCVISSSKGLAEITTAKPPTVQFIHESVRDFLIKDKGLHELWPELGPDWESLSQERLRLCCNNYVFHQAVGKSLSKPDSDGTQSIKEFMPKQYPFLRYASQFILYHANAAADIICQQEFLNHFPVPDWIHTFNIFEKHVIRRYTQEADIIYILADKDLPALIRTRLKENPGIDILGERYGHPLLAAMAKGNKDCVTALLGLPSGFYNGVDITDGLISNMDSVRKFHTPFSWACEHGHISIAKFLFQRGTYIDDMDGQVLTSLMRALRNGYVEVAKWLIGKGVAIESRDKDGWTPLLWAATGGHGASVRLLLDKGAVIDSKDKHGQTPLSFAAQKGHEAVVRLLLNKRAAIESKDSIHSSTPLYWAAWTDHEAVVQLLLDMGASVESRGYLSLTPLLCASIYEHEAVVRLLVDKGADIEARDDGGHTALSCASWTGNEAVDIRGSTPLLYAALGEFASRSRHGAARQEATVRLLLDKGASVESRNDNGQTALSLASSGYGKREGVVQLLLDKGADIESKDNKGRTPLLWAVRAGNEAVVQLLLERGASVKSRDFECQTPLSWAVEEGKETVVQLLRSYGAVK
ncbi:hypothetical protein B0J13DRAFT_526297 [Dactylonectria estremocensis]|uniref:Nucleoside phosphorylase domain-containing protein n=1 Tax=Dactylonectria estremocensis TaxID=1079267 RepID=A0A9P9ES43_9HYPO|nr:hypothetical protein B0J13DRAFT_526297 [Dactylonectria estremocensis]